MATREMKVLTSVAEFREWRRSLRVAADESLGFVPTMGALHAGHESLLLRARAENKSVVLSLFVNPTQFNQASDFEKYPKTVQKDLELAKAAGMTAVFIPEDPKELYPDDYRYRVSENEFSKMLCGEHRPGHFDGVLTVVLKLFQLARADRAYFGEKDYQQLSLIRGMVRAFFLDTEIIACPTVREIDGLAMSSRNVRLAAADRLRAPSLYRVLSESNDLMKARGHLENEGFRVDYLEDQALSDGTRRRFVAAFLGEVRLIDNVPIPSGCAR